MNTTIIDRPAFRLIGYAAQLPLVRHGVNPHIQSHIASIPDPERTRLREFNNTEPPGLLQVSANVDPDYAEGSDLTHLFGVALDAGTSVPDELDVIDVPAGTWAVFRTAGPYPATWEAIARKCLFENSWHLRPGPEIVATLHRPGSETTATTDLWIPITQACSGEEVHKPAYVTQRESLKEKTRTHQQESFQ
ncbi:GyrI-like domain-containing protein [Nesterenkonia sp. CL21]|uniref:GyrI-like domain-containing protein n=1 Tax=Nesterenkonia sp. CL21 TaxID=3064894 RepID=UPI002879E3B7|nr:GyrI-like domain-containing protein [Nesterenkonia sp. CL21]MDS2172381.1 GyrI-like domain-containing protein [Nesterenkonia sp. CL21]